MHPENERGAAVTAPVSSNIATGGSGASVALADVEMMLAAGCALMPLAPGEKFPLAGSVDPRGTWAWDRATTADVGEWLKHGQNVGMVTGAASAGRLVIDIDFGDGHDSCGPEMPDELLDFLASLPTPVALTPKAGVHVHVLGNPERLRTTVLELGGWRLRVQGDGAHVVVPPSTVGGSSYTWASPLEEARLMTFEEFRMELLLRGPRNLRTPVGSLAEVVGIPTTSAALLPAVELAPSGPLSELTLFDGDPDFVVAFCRLLGLPERLGQKFSCPLPGHGPDRHPSANLWRDGRARDGSGIYVMRDHHAGPGERQSYSLTEVYASLRAGRVMTFHDRPVEAAQWKRRLLHELGRLELPEIVKPGLPEDAPPSVRQFLDGFAELLAIREGWFGAGEPTLFTERFACDWCGIRPTAYWEARKYLLRQKILVPAGEVQLKTGGRPARLFQLSTYTPILEEEFVWT